jgi:DNA polymerase-3 subunit beta
MKFSIEKAVLAKAVAQAQSVVERRNTIPILANVLIEAEGDSVRFRATDLDVEVVDRAPARVDQTGATTVAALMLNEIVRKLGDGALVTLSTQGRPAGSPSRRGARPSSSRRCRSRTSRTWPRPTTRRPSRRPRRSCGGSSTSRSSPSHRGDALLPERRVLPCRTGVRGTLLRAVATDGHRLARIDAPLPEGAQGMPGVIVPRKTVNELRKLLDDEAVIKVSCPTPRSASRRRPSR